MPDFFVVIIALNVAVTLGTTYHDNPYIEANKTTTQMGHDHQFTVAISPLCVSARLRISVNSSARLERPAERIAAINSPPPKILFLPYFQ